MSENNQQGQTPEGNGKETTPPVGANETDITKEIEKVKLELQSEFEEKYKGEIAGLNRKNSELKRTLDDIELSGKTEKEKNEILKKENDRILGENAKLDRDRIVDRELGNVGLPLEFAKHITGQDEANIKEDIRNFDKHIKDLAQAEADKIINKRMGGDPPEAGITPAEKQMTRSDFDKLDPQRKSDFINDGGKLIE